MSRETSLRRCIVLTGGTRRLGAAALSPSFKFPGLVAPSFKFPVFFTQWLVAAALAHLDAEREPLPCARLDAEPAGLDLMQRVEEARAAQAAAGPSLPPARELALAMDAGMGELIAAVRGQAEHRTAYGSAIGYASGIGTATGHAIRAPIILAEFGEAGVVTDTLSVRDASSTDVGMPLDAKTVFLAILWLFTFVLPPVVVLMLPAEAQAIIAGYVAAVGNALIITWRVNDSRKR